MDASLGKSVCSLSTSIVDLRRDAAVDVVFVVVDDDVFAFVRRVMSDTAIFANSNASSVSALTRSSLLTLPLWISSKYCIHDRGDRLSTSVVVAVDMVFFGKGMVGGKEVMAAGSSGTVGT